MQKTKKPTFQLKYSSHGGQLGSYSCKLSEIKKVHVPLMTPLQLVESSLRFNRNTLSKMELRVHAIFKAYKKATDKALKSYIV